MSRSLGEAPSIGAGVGIAAVATWLLAGSLPNPRSTSFAVPPPQSAAHAVVAATAAVQPAAGAGPVLALPQADTTQAPSGDRPDVLTLTPPPRATAPPSPSPSPKPVPTQSPSAPPSPGAPQPTPSPEPTQPAPTP